MKRKTMFITGIIVDQGIDGEVFISDYTESQLYDRVKEAYRDGYTRDGQVFKLVPVKIRQQTKDKWDKEKL